MTSKEILEVKKIKKAIAALDENDPIHSSFLIGINLCHSILEKPLSLSQMVDKIWNDASAFEFLISSCHLSREEITEVFESTLKTCLKVGFMEKRGNNYFLTPKGFSVAKDLQKVERYDQ